MELRTGRRGGRLAVPAAQGYRHSRTDSAPLPEYLYLWRVSSPKHDITSLRSFPILPIRFGIMAIRRHRLAIGQIRRLTSFELPCFVSHKACFASTGAWRLPRLLGTSRNRDTLANKRKWLRTPPETQVAWGSLPIIASGPIVQTVPTQKTRPILPGLSTLTS